MLVFVLRFILAIAAGLAFAVPAASQERVGALSHVDGPVLVHHRFVPAVGRAGAVLVEGDQLQTTDGRAEVTFLDGTILHLDSHTRVAFHERGRFQLIDGRIFIRTSAISASGYIAGTPVARVRLMPRGIFGLMTTAEHLDVLLRVVVGDARIESRWGAEPVTAYHTAFVSGPTGRPFVSVYVPPLSDGFENWSASRTMMATLGPGSPPRTVDELARTGPVIDEYRESPGIAYVAVGAYGRFGPAAREIPRGQSGKFDRSDRGERDGDRKGRGGRAGRSREEEAATASAPARTSEPQPTSPPATGSFRVLAKPRS